MLTNWLLGPLKEALKLIFNRILAPYVENLDLNQLNYGLSEGLTFRTPARVHLIHLLQANSPSATCASRRALLLNFVCL